jgi:uncharacterized membrane protein
MKSINLANLKEQRFSKLQESLWIDYESLTKAGAIIAGGSLRTLIDKEDTVCDIDLFFKEEESIANTKSLLEDSEYVCVFQCPLGYLSTYYKFSEKVVGKRFDGSPEYEVLSKVQLITRNLYIDLEHVVSSFDLMPCCVAMDSERIVFADKWVRSVKKKMLYLNNLTYPVATLNRIDKYKRKGYYASEAFYVDIITTIQSSRFDGDRMSLYID